MKFKDLSIGIGSDHAGFVLKKKILAFLISEGYKVINFGCNSTESIDYPDYGHLVANHVVEEKAMGIVICGSGNGINMTVNKYSAIRGALCWNTEITELARLHNNANIISLPARFLDEEKAIEIIKVFFSTEFEAGRHLNRINKIPCE